MIELIEKIAKLFVEIRRQVREVGVELVRSDEVLLVRVGSQFGDQRIPLGAHRSDVRLVEFVEIGGVEAGAEHRVLLSHPRGVERRVCLGGSAHSRLLSVKLTS